MPTVAEGLCQCGCGGETRLARVTDRSKGWVKGEPLRFIHRHGPKGHAAWNRGLIVPMWDRITRHLRFEASLCGCWEWTAACSKSGYAMLSGKRVHRVVYELLVGPIPEGLILDHLCRNTRCVNPLHVEPVTHAENSRRGLNGILKLTCRRGHEFTPENTHIDRTGHRNCRECKRVRRRIKREAGYHWSQL